MARPTLRDFQAEDVAAAVEALRRHRRVLGRAATGLGKAVEIAALAAHYAGSGRVLVLVDVRKLVRQLAETIAWYTGTRPGVEMGDERASHGGWMVPADRVVVSTVQTQYSGEPGRERFREFDPRQFSAVLLDECELFLAPKARGVVDYFLNGNPDLRVYGCTATPCRTDGVAMANLFDAVAFDRDIPWGIREGWLVKPRQAFVRVSLDFSSLKVRRGDDGEADYSEAEVADRVNNEPTLIELAKGIIDVAGDRKAIVVCPSVAVAKGVADYLDGERPGCARWVYGEMSDDDKDAVMEAHQRGEFQFLSSVMMLTKGYDDPSIRAVVNCRKTRSKRLYTQIMGRGTRPARSVVPTLGDAATPDERRAAIAASEKPDVLMVNMVGVDEDVRDVTIVDILGTADAAVTERAKAIMLENGGEIEPAEALALAEEEEATERELERMRAEQAAAVLESEEADRAVRRMVSIGATVDVEYQDDLRVGGGDFAGGPQIEAKHLAVLRDRFKLKDHELARLTPEQAKDLSRQLIARARAGLCSWRQGKTLERAGYTKAEIGPMTRDQASAAIDQLKANNWRRPSTTNEVAA